ncbi:TonB-dependent receptor, partial [Salmonella enterica]|nr:TonB-dependent receptor [Salmonella enterica]
LDKLVSSRLGNTRLILGAENIFNKAYRDASTYGNVAYAETLTNPLVEPGRNFTATLRMKF